MLPPCYLFLFALLLLLAPSLSLERADSRYSFSLTTFDQSGRLGQVEHAFEAARQGTPLVGISIPGSGETGTVPQVILAAPQILPSPLMQDDGTSRFSRITSEIVMSHSGLSADGRVLMAEAHRLAVNHEYTFDEEIPIERLLEELSLLYQEYTMKAGARPFGTTLLLAHQGCFYSIDPSGSVTTLGSCAVLHGDLERTAIRETLQALAVPDMEGPSRDPEEVASGLASALRATLEERLKVKGKIDGDSLFNHMTVLTACLSTDKNFTVKRHKPVPHKQV